MSEKEKIIRVVSILDPRKVAINSGSSDGMRVGDTVLFYSLGQSITDPATGEDLGQLEIVKGKGKVTHAQEKISTVESVNLERMISRPAPMHNGYLNGILGLTERSDPVKFEKPAPYDNISVGDIGKKI
ncbi:hypothetical protein [Acetobacter fabarum]|uniref:hypothetical protein n=1 Tax=Acetobacter fabarum TaxID=483199 RepID=UPI0039E9707F